jgi:hypothetical protein
MLPPGLPPPVPEGSLADAVLLAFLLFVPVLIRFALTDQVNNCRLAIPVLFASLLRRCGVAVFWINFAGERIPALDNLAA